MPNIKRTIFGAVAMAAMVFGHAHAQSSPGLYLGQVPTPAQWNSYFASKQDYNPNLTLIGACSPVGVLGAVCGGTAQSAYASGDILYASAVNTLSRLAKGTDGQVLTLSGGFPSWTAATSIGVTSFSAGTTGFTPSSPTLGAVVLSGTLIPANGGTGLTGFTIGDILYASSSSVLSKLGIGTTNYVLTVVGGVPAWAAAGSGTVTSVAVSGGTTGLTTSGGPVTTTGTITLAGTLAVANGGTGIAAFPLPNYINGLNLSTAGGSGTFGISTGVAADHLNTVLERLTPAYTKTTGAWTLGSTGGCLDTGSIANATWYTVYEIERTDLTAVDIECSTNTSAPSLPTNYTLYRRIGAMKTDGSAHWTQFTQVGNQFVWYTGVQDISVSGSTTPALTSLSVPPGVNVLAQGNALFVNATAIGAYATFTSPLAVSGALNTPAGNISLFESTGAGSAAGQFALMTDTSREIRSVTSATSASISLYWVTTGWIDYRGQQ